MKSFIITMSLLLCSAHALAANSAYPWVDYSENHAKVIAQAKKMGAPAKNIHRAMVELKRKVFDRRDVVSIFDMCQHSKKRRFYVLDFRNGRTKAYHAAHGRGNGPVSGPAKNVSNFWRRNSKMVPMGPLKTEGDAFVFTDSPGYETVVDRYSKSRTRYSGLKILTIEGTCRYNHRNILYVDKNGREYTWNAVHPKWYNTKGYRARFNGLGRSLGCITLDPETNNEVVERIDNGSLVYVVCGNNPIEKYLGGRSCN